MDPTSTRICRKCGLEVAWGKIRKHHIDVHGLKVASGADRKKRVLETAVPAPLSAFETYQKLRQDAKDTMARIDEERSHHQNRLRELDDLAAKMQKLL